jgi:hypothetical protein
MVTESCGPLPFRADVWLLVTGFAGMAMAIAGMARAITGKSNQPDVHPVFFFTAITALLTIAAFSALPYKTPWNILAFYVPMVVLSAYFILNMADRAASRKAKGAYTLILTIMTAHLLWQSYSDNFITYDRPCNPWTYAHPGNDVLCNCSRGGRKSCVGFPGREKHVHRNNRARSGYWPLPWYLRDFPNTGWWEEVTWIYLRPPL